MRTLGEDTVLFHHVSQESEEREQILNVLTIEKEMVIM